VVEERLQQLTAVEVVDIQWEAGDIAHLCFSGKKPPKWLSPTVHAMIVQQLSESGRFINYAKLPLFPRPDSPPSH
jgi:hypothetical protein